MSRKTNNVHSDIKDDMILSDMKDEMVVSDQKEALAALAMDKEFVENLISQKSLKDMQALFSNRGVILSEEEVDLFIEMVRKSSAKEELPDNFFGDIAAGSYERLVNEGMGKLVGSMSACINGEPESKKFGDSVIWKV